MNYKDTPEWGRAVFDLTGGVDRVVNAAGTGSLNQSPAALRPGEEVAVMGLMTSGEALNPMLLTGKALTVRGIAVGDAADLAALAAMIDLYRVKPPIARVFPFEEARQAYEAQASGGCFGKIVIGVT